MLTSIPNWKYQSSISFTTQSTSQSQWFSYHIKLPNVPKDQGKQAYNKYAGEEDEAEEREVYNYLWQTKGDSSGELYASLFPSATCYDAQQQSASPHYVYPHLYTCSLLLFPFHHTLSHPLSKLPQIRSNPKQMCKKNQIQHPVIVPREGVVVLVPSLYAQSVTKGAYM